MKISLAVHAANPVGKMLLFGFLFLWISGVLAKEPTAEELLSYASALATKSQIVKIGAEGIVLNGESIEGVSTRRPSDAIARAAELIMEKGIASRSLREIDQARALWKQIENIHGAIPYLRMAGKGDDSFSGYCLALLATTYAESGDMESAKDIFDRLDGTNLRDDLDAIATAHAARFSLTIGEGDRAEKLQRS